VSWAEVRFAEKAILMASGQGTRLMHMTSNQPKPGSEYPIQLWLSSGTFVKLLRTRLPRPSSEPRW
jgi:hypothetical protein